MGRAPTLTLRRPPQDTSYGKGRSNPLAEARPSRTGARPRRRAKYRGKYRSCPSRVDVAPVEIVGHAKPYLTREHQRRATRRGQIHPTLLRSRRLGTVSRSVASSTTERLLRRCSGATATASWHWRLAFPLRRPESSGHCRGESRQDIVSLEVGSSGLPRSSGWVCSKKRAVLGSVHQIDNHRQLKKSCDECERRHPLHPLGPNLPAPAQYSPVFSDFLTHSKRPQSKTSGNSALEAIGCFISPMLPRTVQ